MKKWFILCLALTGCVLSTTPLRNTRYSVDITKMQKADFYKDTWIYRHPTRKITDFHQFFIEPCVIYSDTHKKINPLDRPLFDTLEKKYFSKIETLMKKDYTVVSQEGPGVLKLAFSIIDIKPVVTLKKKDGNEAVITDTTAKGSKLEIDCYDAESGESILALSTLYKGEEYDAYLDPTLIPNIEMAFDEWSLYFKKRFDQAMASK